MPKPAASPNICLASLPRPALDDLRARLIVVPLVQGRVLCDPDGEVDEVYFPLSGMISLVILMKGGKAVETATVGREGVFGAMAGLGTHVSRVRAIVQIPGAAARISATAFQTLAAQHPSVQNLCIRYNEVLLDQARVNAACNALHQVESRFCRWLLHTSDRAESNVVALTQEFLSEMLGVRRTSVTEVAGKVQEAGIIRYSRGKITILSRRKLEGMACECYETLRNWAPVCRYFSDQRRTGASFPTRNASAALDCLRKQTAGKV